MAAAGPKRLLFHKPTWATETSTKPSSDDSSVFGRNHVYEDILEAERQKRERREARARARIEPETKKGRESKRRRVSTDPGDDEVDSDNGSVRSSCSGVSHGSGLATEIRVTRSTLKKEKALVPGLGETSPRDRPAAKSAAAKSTVIDLREENETEESEMYQTSREVQQKGHVSSRPCRASGEQLDEEEEEDDDYLMELKRKARERARLHRLGIDVSRAKNLSFGTTNNEQLAISPSAEPSRSESAQSPTRSGAESGPPPVQETEDTEVQILITSHIPNSKPLIVRRKASQPLLQVKEFWCQRQGFDAALSAEVFFTWRGTRLFNSTTMRSVLHRLERDHAQRGIETGDPTKGNIELEAVTPKIFEIRQKQRERELAENAGLVDNHGDSDDGPMPGTAAGNDPLMMMNQTASDPNQKGALVIRLTCQEHEPMLLRVRPHTSISKIMLGFQKTMKVEEGKTCWLVFDGDRLDPRATVEEVGFEDEDTVEVYLR